MQCVRVALTVRKAWAILLALALCLVPATAATAAAPQATVTERQLDETAGWHGRGIRQPHHHDGARTSAKPPPRGWSAGPVSLGTGLQRPSGSQRVREVQRRLRRLGYRTGPVDGIYGPRTRAAVGWFQHKHGLPVDGRAVFATVGHLRERTGAALAQGPATGAEPGEAASPSPSATAAPPAAPPVPAATPAEPTAQAADEGSPSWWRIAGLAFFVLVFLVLGYVVGRRWRREADAVAPVEAPQPLPQESAGMQARPTRGARAVGYIQLARGAPSASFHAQAAAIETGCLAREMTLVSLVSDVEPHDRTGRRPPALDFALERLRSGEVDRLVVSRLDHLARTREELEGLLEVVDESDAALVVLDLDLDIAALPDSDAVDVLLRHDPGPRTRLPREVDTHAVDTHIASMLDEGLSTRDIAAALNAEPVPAPEGPQWGFDGVEAVLRRRRGRMAERVESTDA